MNVLIVGSSSVNGPLAQELAVRGYGSSVVNNLAEIKRVRGEPGAYVAVTREREIPAVGIIVTQPPDTERLQIGDGLALSLQQPDLIEQLEAAEPEDRIVFLLDYAAETPEYLTLEALLTVRALAAKKRKAVFLSRFVKTAQSGMEKAYREARRAGVTFIKYENIRCDYIDGQFVISADDGVFESEYKTSFLVAAGAECASPAEEIIRKLRLAKSNHGFVNGNKYFLSPALTTRRGVYYLHPGLTERERELEVRKALPAICGELGEIAREPRPPVYAVVDKEKCAFCYSCHRACPHAALEPDLENRAMRCTESACTACGTCVAICPGQAISLESETLELATLEVDRKSAGRCKVFCCENSAYPAMMEAARLLGEDGNRLDIVKVPCGGRVGQEKIAGAIAGYDKVLLAVCVEDACRHMVGDRRARQHAGKMMDTALQMKLPGKKIACIQASHAMKRSLADKVRAFLSDEDENVEGES